MDVKTTFLNGVIEEEVYIEQLLVRVRPRVIRDGANKTPCTPAPSTLISCNHIVGELSSDMPEENYRNLRDINPRV